MRRKMLNVPKGSYDGMKGFTIIEFLVAGLLSMIVLMAVGSSYFTSRKLMMRQTSVLPRNRICGMRQH